jgi:hypothetical protein
LVLRVDCIGLSDLKPGWKSAARIRKVANPCGRKAI